MAALRSKPVRVKPIVSKRTGSISYQVLGTIRGKQEKKHTQDQNEAFQIQAVWELEQTLAAATLRPKVTRLTYDQLKEAESAFDLLQGTSFSLLDAIRNLLRNPPAKRADVTFANGYQHFLVAKKDRLSERQWKNCESIGRRFSMFLAPGTLVGDVSSEQITALLGGPGCGKKSWNTYRDDLGGIFTWFSEEPRSWIPGGQPMKAVERYRKRDTLPGIPERLRGTERVRIDRLRHDFPPFNRPRLTVIRARIRPSDQTSPSVNPIVSVTR